MNYTSSPIELSNQKRKNQSPKITIDRIRTLQLFMRTPHREKDLAEVNGHETHQNDLDIVIYLGQITLKGEGGVVLCKYLNYDQYVNVCVWAQYKKARSVCINIVVFKL